MMSLNDTHPDIEEEFERGNFVLHKSQRDFSGLAFDQAHEQNNALVKSDGGAIGITEKPSALLRWMISGPELCQLVNEYEETNQNRQTKHHEDVLSAQKNFSRDVSKLTEMIEELGNPFIEDSGKLLTLATKRVSDADTLEMFKNRGQEQHETFNQNMKTFYEPIKRNQFAVFATEESKSKLKPQSKTKNVKQNCALFF